MIETITPAELLTTLAAALLIGAIVIFYLAIIKPNQDEKNERKKAKGPQDTLPAEPDQYSDIIDEYPTYNRQVK